MTTADEAVLKFIGREGRSPEAVSERFPAFDVMRLVRAQLVAVEPPEVVDTSAHVHEPSLSQVRYVLTPRGEQAVGIGSRAVSD
jgi:hypothetical protein